MKQTDLGGELNLNGFLSDGADFERSLASLRFLPPLPSSWNGLRSKYSVGCIFNLNTPAFIDDLWCAISL